MTGPVYRDDLVELWHGDAIDCTAWLAADVLIMDPPYGVSYRRRSGPMLIAGDEDTGLRDALLEMWGERPALVFGSWKRDRPEGVRERIIWFKRNTNPGLGGTPWAPADEEVYVLGDGWLGPRTLNVIVTDEARSSSGGQAAKIGHPTPKPIRLLEELILHCPPEWVIADATAGSGSTLLAARRLGRRAIGVELEAKYCDIARARLNQGTMDLSP